MLMDSSRARGSTAFLDFTYSCQASAEHFEQCAEFLPLRNRGLGPLAVTVLSVPLARRAAATGRAAVQSAAAFFRRWRSAGFPAPRQRSAFGLSEIARVVGFSCARS
jgi:hypothetical protein